MLEVELTKPQILELYLNRVYLSAGVYGVETMSEHLFRKPASELTLRRGGARSPGSIRAPSALSPWSNYEGALERSHVVLAADARAEVHHAGAGGGGAQGAAAHPALPTVARRREPAGRRSTCGSSSASEFGGDHPPDWQVQTTFDRRRAGRGGEGGGRRACSAWATHGPRGGARRASIRRPATCSRWSAAATTCAAPSIARRAAGGSRARRSSRSSTRPRSTRGYSPVSVLTNLDHVTAPAGRSRMVAAQRRKARRPTALTLRAALMESNNAAAVELQQRVGTRAVLRLASDAGLEELPTCRRWRSAPAWCRRSISPRRTRCFPAAARWSNRARMLSVLDAEGDEVFAQERRAAARAERAGGVPDG